MPRDVAGSAIRIGDKERLSGCGVSSARPTARGSQEASKRSPKRLPRDQEASKRFIQEIHEMVPKRFP
jgi:hypothetical protein